MFANYNCHTAFGKMIIAVMVKNGDDQLMNRQDAIAVAQSEFGVSCRVEHAFTMSKKLGEGFFDANMAKGWGFIKRV